MIEVEQSVYAVIPLDCIVSKLKVRSLSPKGVARIKESIQRLGFLENYPLIVVPLGDGKYQLVDGNHRYTAALECGETVIPCMVRSDLSETELYKLALESNSAAEAVVPSTMVTFAEFVWAREEEGSTQFEIAEMLRWKRGAVSNYALLNDIDKTVWKIIATTFEESVASVDDDAVAPIATDVAFTENLLRDILSLSPEQQLELVSAFANPKKNDRITKSAFKTRAGNYVSRNKANEYALQQLGNLGDPYISKLTEEVYSGAYDDEWRKSQDEKSKSYGQHPKLDKLIASIQDEWEQKNSIHLIEGDFYIRIGSIGDASIDLILTDPPYNVANKREFTMSGRSNISQDFGEWDKYDRQQFIDLFGIWSGEWARILRENGSGYVFTSDIYMSYLRAALEQSGLHVKSTIVWHKTNPPPQFEKTTFRSTVEYILFFTKSENDYTFNWQGDKVEMHNFIECSICSGDERLVDTKGDTLHPTQKPEKVLRHLMEISSNRGDMVFDGFAGVGSSGKSAKDLGRKFIGIEKNAIFFDAMRRRLAND